MNLFNLVSLESNWYVSFLILIIILLVLLLVGFIIYRFKDAFTPNKKVVVNDSKKETDLKQLSQCALECADSFNDILEDNNGIELVGIIYSKSKKLILVHPKGQKVKPGDVVKVLDLCGNERIVPVVIGNKMISKSHVKSNELNIVDVVYRS